MAGRIVILGAGFGGLELATVLSSALGSDADVILIDKAESFMFGYSKLELLFGWASREKLSLPYSAITKPGVRFVRETITAIDPESRRVTTDRNQYHADHLVVALGAEMAYEATPGLTESEAFYSVAGAAQLAGAVASFASGHAVIGVCGIPYKCTPAPSECALLLHDELVSRGVRDDCKISYIAAQPSPGLIARKKFVPVRPFRIGLVVDLLRRPVWLGGIAAMIGGVVLQALALHGGAIAFVEPILVLELPATLLLAALMRRK